MIGGNLAVNVQTGSLRQVEGERAVGFVITAFHVEHLQGVLGGAVLEVEFFTRQAARVEDHLEVEGLYMSWIGRKVIHSITSDKVISKVLY